MPKRRSRYTVRADGRLQRKITVDGVQHTLYGYTDAEIDAKLLDLKATIAHGKYFREVVEEWETWREHNSNVSIATHRAYEAPSKDALERFGGERIGKISTKDIKAVLNEMARKNYSIKTIKKYYTFYRGVFLFAMENDYIDNNPAEAVTMPSFAKAAQRRDPATESEEAIIKANADEWLLPYFLLMTGMRKGEALAIQGQDIDREARKIYVTKSVAYKYNQPYIKEPKTAAGVRTVPLLDELAAHLPELEPGQFLFSPAGENRPMSMMVFQRYWARFRAATGVQCGAHQLRHSFATMLYDAGIDAKQAQDILGHAQESTTMDIYTHIRDSRRASALDTLNAYIAKK